MRNERRLWLWLLCRRGRGGCHQTRDRRCGAVCDVATLACGQGRGSGLGLNRCGHRCGHWRGDRHGDRRRRGRRGTHRRDGRVHCGRMRCCGWHWGRGRSVGRRVCDGRRGLRTGQRARRSGDRCRGCDHSGGGGLGRAKHELVEAHLTVRLGAHLLDDAVRAQQSEASLATEALAGVVSPALPAQYVARDYLSARNTNGPRRCWLCCETQKNAGMRGLPVTAGLVGSAGEDSSGTSWTYCTGKMPTLPSSSPSHQFASTLRVTLTICPARRGRSVGAPPAKSHRAFARATVGSAMQGT